MKCLSTQSASWGSLHFEEWRPPVLNHVDKQALHWSWECAECQMRPHQGWKPHACPNCALRRPKNAPSKTWCFQLSPAGCFEILLSMSFMSALMWDPSKSWHRKKNVPKHPALRNSRGFAYEWRFSHPPCQVMEQNDFHHLAMKTNGALESVLVCHDHDTPVAKWFYGIVNFLLLQTCPSARLLFELTSVSGQWFLGCLWKDFCTSAGHLFCYANLRCAIASHKRMKVVNLEVKKWWGNHHHTTQIDPYRSM